MELPLARSEDRLRVAKQRVAKQGVELHLVVSDPDTMAELSRLPAGPEREEYLLRALKIGLLALRQATGAIDADAVRREGEQILQKLQSHLEGHQELVNDNLQRVLREYFDPESGRFQERVQRLVAKDGDLERVLREQVGGEDSTLLRTLAAQVGPESPLMKILSPSESEGLLKSLETRLDEALGNQRERILAQFSLDNRDGALSRLVRELNEKNENITQQLRERIGDVVEEFSLDKEDSALSKLVRRVDATQEKISAEFSLDVESSALARMRRDMLAVIEKHGKDDRDFRQKVLTELADLRGRRAERATSTRHGDDFEADLFGEIQKRAQAAGDIAIDTGNEPGIVRRSKKGDAVIELSPEHAAAGRKIVFEAKEDRSYTLARARGEIRAARENRQADVGVFVFSSKTAPVGLEQFQRLGNDVFVIWDARDAASDVWLDAAVEVARAIVSASTSEDGAEREDIEAIEKAIHAIAQQSGFLDEITKWSKTIASNTVQIQERVRKSQTDFLRQVERLKAAVRDLKGE